MQSSQRSKANPIREPQVESEWWKGRTREGREGWFPKKWVQVLERRKPGPAPTPSEGEGKKVES